jgi:hypothetical protein
MSGIYAEILEPYAAYTVINNVDEKGRAGRTSREFLDTNQKKRSYCTP